jgi:uncharacterized membrane protein
MDWFALIALIVTGFTACAEFGSYAFVHPVVRRLPANYHIQVEQGLLKTFGRVMPVLMTLCSVIGVSYLVYVWSLGAREQLLAALSAISFGASIVSTIIFNVPINLATGRWDAEHPPQDWEKTRNKWEFFQGVRSWLLLIGFVFLAATIADQLGNKSIE